jgi:simple sugar transport system permease protein
MQGQANILDLGQTFKRLLRPLRGGAIGGLWALLIALLALFSLIMPSQFPTTGTVQAMMFQLPELGLLALAQVVPLITGGINLAIISTANQAALVMVWAMKLAMHAGAPDSMAIVAGLLVGLALSIFIGLITGALVAYTGVHPVLVTLGTNSLIDGVSIYLTRGTIVSGLPASFQWIGSGAILGVPAGFIFFLIISGLVGVVFRRTPFGVSMYMIGSNLPATQYSGIDTRRVLIGAYALSSVLCFCAAVLMMARFNSASADYARSYLLVTILAAVLGGIDPMGGFGRVGGLVLALLVLQVLSSGCNLLGFSQHLTLAIWALTLIGTMAARIAGPALMAVCWPVAAPPTPPPDPNRELRPSVRSSGDVHHS